MSSGDSPLAADLIVDALVVSRNCATSIERVVRGIRAQGVRSCVVVDAGSQDDSAGRAEAAGAVVLRVPEAGYGRACLRALQHLQSLPRQPDIVVFASQDGFEHPADIRRLVEPIEEGGAEMVIGAQRESSASSLVGERLVVGLMNVIYRHNYQTLGRFRALRFPALVALGLSDLGEGFDAEMQVKAVRLGLKIDEVQVEPGSGTTRRGRDIRRTGKMFLRVIRHSTAR